MSTTDNRTPEQDEIAAMAFEIGALEDAAQDAEDNEQLGRASSLRVKARALKVRLDALVLASAKVSS
jgi:hypothetical protein